MRDDVLSTNWSFNELKTLVRKIVGERGENHDSINAEIKGIEFSGENGEAKLIVQMADETQIRLKIASHTYLN